MAGNYVWPVDAVSGAPTFSARQGRQLSIAPFVAGATATRPLGARSGVRPGTPTSTVTATSTTWTVNPHVGVIDAEAAAQAGPYAYSFDQVQTGNMTAASGSYARIDLISVQISDPAESDGTSVPSATIVYTPGTAAAPALPAQPARSMVLAQINVPISGGGSPSVTWVAPTLVGPGGITPATQAAFGSGTYTGQYIDDPSFGLLRWNGSAWSSASLSITGHATRTSSNGTIANSTVTTFGFDGPSLTGGMTCASNATFTVPIAGRYLVAFAAVFAQNGTGARVAWVLKNGATRVIEDDQTGSSVAASVMKGSRVLDLAAGDTLALQVYQTSGGNLDITSSPTAPYLTIDYLGA